VLQTGKYTLLRTGTKEYAFDDLSLHEYTCDVDCVTVRLESVIVLMSVASSHKNKLEMESIPNLWEEKKNKGGTQED
jgi:hypothetical protein